MLTLSPALKQALLYSMGLLIMKSVSLVLVPIVTRHLPPVEYGTLEILVTIANLGTIILGFGLADSLYRFAGQAESENEKKTVCANIFTLAIIIGLGAGIVVQLLAPLIGSFLPGAITQTQLRLILLTLSLEGCIAIPLAWLRMGDGVKQFLWFSCGKALLQAAMTITALQMGFGVTGVLVSGTVSASLLALALIYLQWQQTGLAFDAPFWKKIMVYGGPLIFSGIAAFAMGGLDRLLIAEKVGIAQMAAYAIAVKFATITSLMLQPYSMWWFPKRFSLLGSPAQKQENARLSALGVGYGFIVAAAMGIVAPVAITLMVPESYHGATVFAPYLVLIVALRYSSDFLNIGCFLNRTGNLPMLINMGGALMAVLGFFTLIPLLGIPGAILSMVMAQLARLALFYHFSNKAMPLPYPVNSLVFIASMAVCSVIISTLIQGIPAKLLLFIPLWGVVVYMGFSRGIIPPIGRLLRLRPATG
jgi:O-antigen/teichoic acid export membrane protein